MAVLGNDIIMIASSTDDSSASTIVAATKSHDITVTCDTIETASPTQGQWREYLAGRKEWELSTSWLLVSQGFNTQMLKPGYTYSITIGQRATPTISNSLTGNVICTQAHITATRGSLVQGSFKFKGTGTLS